MGLTYNVCIRLTPVLRVLNIIVSRCVVRTRNSEQRTDHEELDCIISQRQQHLKSGHSSHQGTTGVPERANGPLLHQVTSPYYGWGRR